jgi:hypothetical protein
MTMKTHARLLVAVQRVACVTGLVVLGGCAVFTYVPPAPLATIENARTIDASYDETWTALVNYVSGGFFGIKTFEKASGLLTLSFGGADPSKFVECGTWKTLGGESRYVDRDELAFVLDGQMNLFVQSLGPRRTQVRVTTRYVRRDNSRNVYEFTSNSSATIDVRDAAQGTIPTRTCRSTHAAEKQILAGISAISRR